MLVTYTCIVYIQLVLYKVELMVVIIKFHIALIIDLWMVFTLLIFNNIIVGKSCVVIVNLQSF